MSHVSLSSSSSSSAETPSASHPTPRAATGSPNLSGDVLHGILRYLDFRSIGALACTSKHFYSVVIPVVNQSKPIEQGQFIETLILKLKGTHPEQVESLKKILSGITEKLQKSGYQPEQADKAEIDDDTVAFSEDEESDSN